MDLGITADFNMEIYRVNKDGSQGLIIPYIGLTFENTRQLNRCGYIGGDGDFASDKVIIDVFTNCVAKKYNYKTLVERGSCIKEVYTELVYLPFAPSIENLSIYLYGILCEEYRKVGVKLLSVHVKDAMFITTYPMN